MIKLALKPSFRTIPFETSSNTFLIGAGAQPVLIDTGGGALVGPSLCKLLISLPPKIFGEAASDRALLGADHMQFAGLGHLRSNGAAWT